MSAIAKYLFFLAQTQAVVDRRFGGHASTRQLLRVVIGRLVAFLPIAHTATAVAAIHSIIGVSKITRSIALLLFAAALAMIWSAVFDDARLDAAHQEVTVIEKKDLSPRYRAAKRHLITSWVAFFIAMIAAASSDTWRQ